MTRAQAENLLDKLIAAWPNDRERWYEIWPENIEKFPYDIAVRVIDRFMRSSFERMPSLADLHGALRHETEVVESDTLYWLRHQQEKYGR